MATYPQAFTNYCSAVAGDSTVELLTASEGDLKVTITALVGDLWVGVAGDSNIPNSSTLSTEFASGGSYPSGWGGGFLLKQGQTQDFELRDGDQLYGGSGGSSVSVYSYWASPLPA